MFCGSVKFLWLGFWNNLDISTKGTEGFTMLLQLFTSPHLGRL